MLTHEPKRLQRRPHYQGLPIPANVVIDSRTGVPDFACIDSERGGKLAAAYKCALCGEKMRRAFAFIGGTISAASLTFTDGPMHKECARYAFAACPFVSGNHRQYRSGYKEHEGFRAAPIPSVESKESILVLASSYTIHKVEGVTIYLAEDAAEKGA